MRGDPIVQRYNSAPHETHDETLRFIAEQREEYARREEITWGLLLREFDRVVGCVSLFEWDSYHRRALIGYDLAKEQWGNGLAQEAIRAVLRFAFSELDLNRVESGPVPRTRGPSTRSSSGFRVGWHVAPSNSRGRWTFYDCAVFALLREQWQVVSEIDPAKLA